jgi:L-alanine-DL-glutamate epimerase-like enolase superfamily enzyme
MKIRSVAVHEHAVPLSKPYTIASGATDAVELVVIELGGDAGIVGLGAGTPEPTVTGETFAACRAALAPERTERFLGRSLADVGELLRVVERGWSETPAAAAALDMALHDLRARALGLPLIELLGRSRDRLPTSVTIGILPVEQAVAEAESFVANGFRALKIKIGLDLDADLERIAKIRECVGDAIALRVDGNCGFRPDELDRLLQGCEREGVELVEQPCPPETDEELRALPASVRRLLIADESIHSPADALRLASGTVSGTPIYGGFVVKLMKCGGIAPALRIAAIAQSAGLELMWGCMDESAVGIAAALHAAYSAPATRWLDLDGSFDLARDPGRGGFHLDQGRMSTLPTPGLGAELEP